MKVRTLAAASAVALVLWVLLIAALVQWVLPVVRWAALVAELMGQAVVGVLGS